MDHDLVRDVLTAPADDFRPTVEINIAGTENGEEARVLERRVRWMRGRRSRRRGTFSAIVARVEQTAGDRGRSRELHCFVRVVGSGAATRLRLATGTRGDRLVPTGEEAERAAKEVALARVARLEAELRRSRR